MNVALQDPHKFFFNPTIVFFSSKATKSWIVSSLLGETTYYSAGKQICVAPSAHGWHRFVVVLAQVLGQHVLYFPSYRGGVSFANNRFDTGPPNNNKWSKGPPSPIGGPVLAENQPSEWWCIGPSLSYLYG